MGLEEKRTIQKVKTQYIPDFEGRIKEACGFPVALEVDWESYGDNKALIEETESAFFCAFVALKELCKDDLGKELSKAAVKKVRIVNVGEGEFSSCFEDGVVTIKLPKGGAASVGYSPRVEEVIGAGL